MDQALACAPHSASRAVAERLNQGCFCVTLDRAALCKALVRESGEPEFCAQAIETRPHLFSNVPVFLPSTVIGEMAGIVAAIEEVARLPAYREAVLARAPEIAQQDRGPIGAFMGYDFHLDGEAAADRDQHQCRRCLPQRAAGAGAARLLRRGGGGTGDA